MGECLKKHEYALRADFERAAATRELNYEIDVGMVYREVDLRRTCFSLGTGNVESVYR